MNIKSVFFIAGALCAFQIGMAQTGPGGQGRNFDPKAMAERQTKLMKDSLDLSADQLTKVEGIHLKYAEEMAAAREANQGDRDAMRAKMRELRPRQEEELKAVLNAEQWSEYVRIRQEMRSRYQRGQGGQGGRP